MRLEINQSEQLIIPACEKYSHGDKRIEVKIDEVYSFSASKSKYWIDMYWPSKARGFNNPFIKNEDIRIVGAKCFELIGTIDQNDEHYFRIGMGLNNHVIVEDGILNFFANDHPQHYWNNFMSMKLSVKRIQ